MKKFLTIAASLLLIFNGIGALYGGLNLITHPDGSSMQMSMDFLKHTPFQNYLIPGIVLFIVNGLFSFIVLTALIFRYSYASWLVLAQGTILTGWICIQILLIQTIHPLHIIMGSVGIALIAVGWLHKKYLLNVHKFQS